METLPRPLPIIVIADERSAALGSVMSDPLAEPTWTNRMGTDSAPALAAAIRMRSALRPHK